MLDQKTGVYQFGYKVKTTVSPVQGDYTQKGM